MQKKESAKTTSIMNKRKASFEEHEPTQKKTRTNSESTDVESSQYNAECQTTNIFASFGNPSKSNDVLYVQMFPAQYKPSKSEGNEGEKKVYEMLSQMTCSQPIYALHSVECPWVHKGKNYQGESDFIVYDSETHTIFALEVKDCDESQYRNDVYDMNVSKGFLQALRGCVVLRSTLPFSGLNFCSAVILPRRSTVHTISKLRFQKASHNNLYQTLETVSRSYHMPDISLTNLFGSSIVQSADDFKQWFQTMKNAFRRQSDYSYEKIAKELLDKYCSDKLIATDILANEKTIENKWTKYTGHRVHRLTTEQYYVKYSYEHRVVVEGLAGTGKTLCAIMKVKQFSIRDYTVIYICKTVDLASHLGERDKDSGATYCTYNIFLKTLAEENSVDRNIDSLASCFLASDFQVKTKYNCFIVDEAQDIPLEGLNLLLKIADSKRDSALWIFRDFEQKYYRKDAPFSLAAHFKTLNGTTFKSFNLSHILRHTENIHKVVLKSIVKSNKKSQYITIDKEQNNLEVTGVLVSESADKDRAPQDLNYALNSFLDAVLDPNPQFNDIAILISYGLGDAKRQNQNLLKFVTNIVRKRLKDSKLDGTYIADRTASLIESDGGRTRIYCDTIKKFAGLEASCVLLIDLFYPDNVNGEANYLYTGTSRARSLLKIVGTKQLLQKFEIKASNNSQPLPPKKK